MGTGFRRIRTWMTENAYLVTLGCLMAIVVSCAMYTREWQRKQHDGVQAAAGAPETQITAAPSCTPAPTPLPTIAPLGVRPSALVQRGGAWPVEGGVLRAFDSRDMVYWESLGQWKMHEGLDIASQAGAVVTASMDGEVISTVWDELWGWRMRIRHEDGQEMVYAGLESCLVEPKQSVRRGTMLGTLLESIPCEAEVETHLHLEMHHEGLARDPEAVLEER